MAKKELNNPIQEYLNNNSSESNFIELFEATPKDVDLKTDLSIQEIVIINKLILDDEFIDKNLDFSLFGSFLNHYLRLKVSLDRKSRYEFVDVNRRDRFKQNLQDFGNMSNIMEVKK